jgi:MYXO-CTERM domain-containing protein
VQVAFGGSPSALALGASSYTGVDPLDPTGNFASHTGTGNAPQSLSVSVAIQAGDYTVDVLCGSSSGGAPSPGVGALQSQRWRRSTGDLTGVGSTQPNVTSDGRATMSWTLDGSGSIDWSIATVPLNPAPPAPDAGPDVAPDLAPDLGEPDLPVDLAPDLPPEDAAPEDAAPDAGAPDQAEDAAVPDVALPTDDVAPGTVDVNWRVGCACRTGGRSGGVWPVAIVLLAVWRRRWTRTRRLR